MTKRPIPAEAVTDLGNQFEIQPAVDSGARLVVGAIGLGCLVVASLLLSWIYGGSNV